jgi:hypothetical protein
LGEKTRTADFGLACGMMDQRVEMLTILFYLTGQSSSLMGLDPRIGSRNNLDALKVSLRLDFGGQTLADS